MDGKTSISAAGIPRRAVVKGAAWSVPVVAASVAAPAFAASTDCACFVPDTLGSGANFSVNQISGGAGVVVYNSGFGIDGTRCARTSQTYQVTVLEATLTMSHGQSVQGRIVSGGVTNNSFANAHGAVPSNFEFAGVSFPDGNYSSIGNTPVAQPASLSVTVRFDWDGKSCTKVLNYQFTMANVGNFSSGQVSGGTAVIGVAYQMTIIGI